MYARNGQMFFGISLKTGIQFLWIVNLDFGVPKMIASELPDGGTFRSEIGKSGQGMLRL
jgi:hypothetical protein